MATGHYGHPTSLSELPRRGHRSRAKSRDRRRRLRRGLGSTSPPHVVNASPRGFACSEPGSGPALSGPWGYLVACLPGLGVKAPEAYYYVALGGLSSGEAFV